MEKVNKTQNAISNCTKQCSKKFARKNKFNDLEKREASNVFSKLKVKDVIAVLSVAYAILFLIY